MMSSINKKQWRQEARNILAHISIERKQTSASFLFETLREWLPAQGFVLSFVSMRWEISLHSCNNWLFSRGQLVLPCIQVTSETPVDKVLCARKPPVSPGGLCTSSWGGLEPCAGDPQVFAEELGAVIVPGLLFDASGGRLGHGWGCYDRFLSTLPPHTRTLGVGFQEQLSKHDLRVEAHDVALHEVILV